MDSRVMMDSSSKSLWSAFGAPYPTIILYNLGKLKHQNFRVERFVYLTAPSRADFPHPVPPKLYQLFERLIPQR
jgi:hypothetical protein